MLRVFRRVADRLWIPHQAALEFQENRLGVTAEQVKLYDEVTNAVKDVQANLHARLSNLQLRKRHSAIDPNELLGKVDHLFSSFQKRLREMEERQPNVHDEDKLRDQIDTLFEGKVGPPPQSQEDLERLYKEGDLRYQSKRPPGYMDATKKDDARVYLYGDLQIRTEYGDWILWKQILEEAKAREQLRHVIFITEDDKEDWWWIVNSRGNKTIGPRPELVHEIATKADISLFYMYNSERFLTYAQDFLDISVKKESVDQVRDVAQVSERERQRRYYSEMQELASLAKEAVRAWLRYSQPASLIIAQKAGFPDLIVFDKTGTRAGYDVGVTRSLRLGRLRRLRELVNRGYAEVGEGNLDTFYVVLVGENETDAREIARFLDSQRLVIPSGVSVIVGMLVPPEKDQETKYAFIPLSQHGDSEDNNSVS